MSEVACHFRYLHLDLPCAECDENIKKDCPQLNKIIETLNGYQIATGRTDNHNSQIAALANFGLGIGGESGEVQDIIKKFVFHGHPLDRDKIRGELGDVLWYIARIAKWADLTLEEVARGNIDKLKRRYPGGFDKEKSINREDI